MIKKLARSIREYKRDCILTPVFVVVEVIMEVLIPFLIQTIRTRSGSLSVRHCRS